MMRRLNFDTAQEIRAKYLAGNRTQTSIAREYGIPRNRVCKIVNGQIYSNELRGGARGKGMDEPDRDRSQIERGFSKNNTVWGSLLSDPSFMSKALTSNRLSS